MPPVRQLRRYTKYYSDSAAAPEHRIVPLSRMFCFAAVWILALSSSTAAVSAYGQAMPPPASAQATAQSQIDNTDTGSAATSADSDGSESGKGSTALANVTPQTSLSADQIINILQESPDLIVELKSELADRLEQQGVQIGPNDISDEMLYSQISSNANLRASITSVLRARGVCIRGRPSIHGIKRPTGKHSQSFVLCGSLRSCGAAMQPRPDLPQASVGAEVCRTLAEIAIR